MVEVTFNEGQTLADIAVITGYKGTSLVPLAEWTVDEWHKLAVPKALEVFSGGLPDFSYHPNRDIPTHKVALEKFDVEILGVNHGIGAKVGSDKTENLKDFMTNVKSHYKWVFEEGLHVAFGIFPDNSRETRDVGMFFLGDEVNNLSPDEYHAKRVGFLTEIFEILKTIEQSGVFTPLRHPTAKTLLDEVLQKPDLSPEFRHTIGARLYNDILKLPEPLDIEIGHLLQSGGDIAKPNFLTDRSKYMAYRLAAYSKRLRDEGHDHPIIGFITGDFHRSQVAYMLANPDYDYRKSLTMARKLILQEAA